MRHYSLYNPLFRVRSDEVALSCPGSRGIVRLCMAPREKLLRDKDLSLFINVMQHESICIEYCPPPSVTVG